MELTMVEMFLGWPQSFRYNGTRACRSIRMPNAHQGMSESRFPYLVRLFQSLHSPTRSTILRTLRMMTVVLCWNGDVHPYGLRHEMHEMHEQDSLLAKLLHSKNKDTLSTNCARM